MSTKAICVRECDRCHATDQHESVIDHASSNAALLWWRSGDAWSRVFVNGEPHAELCPACSAAFGMIRSEPAS